MLLPPIQQEEKVPEILFKKKLASKEAFTLSGIKFKVFYFSLDSIKKSNPLLNFINSKGKKLKMKTIQIINLCPFFLITFYCTLKHFLQGFKQSVFAWWITQISHSKGLS